MRESHSCDRDPELYRKVKECVSMQQVVEYYGIQVNRKGLCLCPFHQDKNPSLKIYPNGKGFYCFACGAGGDQVKFAAKYRNLRNEEAALELAAAFQVPLSVPRTYREKREAEMAARHRKELDVFVKRSKLYLRMYWILLCEARRNPRDPHFLEGIHRLEYIEYLLGCLDKCPEEVWGDQKAVRSIGEIERRVIGWHDSPEAGRAVSG